MAALRNEGKLDGDKLAESLVKIEGATSLLFHELAMDLSEAERGNFANMYVLKKIRAQAG